MQITGITKEEGVRADFYIGTKDQLMAAGLVRADQFPAAGRTWVTFMDGERLVRKYSYKMDERYLRVQRWMGEGVYRVWVGISRDVARQRRNEERDRVRAGQAERARAELARVAENAREQLACVPRTADDLRRRLVQEARQMMRFIVDGGLVHGRHGYSLAPESLERVLVSVDAVAEAIMAADVELDHVAHLALINGYQAAIAAAGCDSIGKQLARLAEPSALVLDEVQS